MFTKFYSDEDQVLYRPTVQTKANLEHDQFALCANCTEYHEGVDSKAYQAYCDSCGQHQVFGHLNLSQI